MVFLKKQTEDDELLITSNDKVVLGYMHR